MAAFDPIAEITSKTPLTYANAALMRITYPRFVLYFFDTRDNGTFIEDDVGIECADVEAAKTQAALSLAELARDVLPGSIKRVLSVEVRDAIQPILTDVLTFEVILLAEQ
jgi:hypothetical protein